MDNMPYQIRYNTMDTVLIETNQRLGKWNDNLKEVLDKANNIVGMDSFSGYAASNVKSYLEEVYSVIMLGLSQAILDYQAKFLLYKNGYYSIESNIYAVMTTSTMKWYYDKAGERQESQISFEENVNSVLDGINDIVYIGHPSSGTLQSDLQAIRNSADALGKAIDTYEISAVQGDLAQLRKLIGDITDVIVSYKNDVHRIANYNPGLYTRNPSVGNLARSIQKSIEYTSENKQKIDSAAKHQNEVFSQMKADYEKACEEAAKTRADKGGAEIVMGIAAVGIGAFCIVATAGAATPAVVGLGIAAGTSSALFGASQAIEGVQDVAYGLGGDISTASFNLIRDTVFTSNPNLYYIWGDLSMTAAGIMIPLGGVIDTAVAAGATGKELTKTVLFTLGKEVAVDKVSDEIAGSVTSGLQNSFGWGETGTALFNVILSLGIEKGIDKGIDASYSKLKANTDFSSQMYSGDAERYNAWMDNHTPWVEQMDAEDAARYSIWNSECASGNHSNHPGLEPSDIKLWEIADGHVEESLAVARVNVDEFINLRQSRVADFLSDSEAEEYAFNAIKGSDRADAFVLGKFDKGGPNSYSNVARDMGAQYFDLDNYDELAKIYSDDEIWKINQKFLDIEMSSGREIYFSHKPSIYEGDGSFFAREIDYLKQNGYLDHIEKVNGVWHARK